jgi:AcrR family transcriptional regulator
LRLGRRERGKRPKEAVYALDQAVFGHSDNVEADEDQVFSFVELPAVTESIVVLIDPRGGRQASVGMLGAKCPDVGFEIVVTDVEVEWVAELEVRCYGLLEMASDLVGIGFVPHRKVVIGGWERKQTHSRYYKGLLQLCKEGVIVDSARIGYMPTQSERRDATRGAIVDAAKELFAERGFEQTSVADILELAGISRGALYHHFSAKEDVFAEVFVMTSSAALRRAVERVPPDAAPLDALVAGCLSWLDAVKDPAIHRILFVEGPTALGWERVRTLEEATSLRLMRAGVRRAVEAKEITVPSADLSARLLNGLLAEAALTLQGASAARRRDVRALVAAMVKGLQAR